MMKWVSLQELALGKEAQDNINYLIHDPDTTVFISFYDNKGEEQVFELNTDISILTMRTVKE